MSEELYKVSRATIVNSEPEVSSFTAQKKQPSEAYKSVEGNNSQEGNNGANNANIREASSEGYRITGRDNSERIIGDDDGTQIDRARSTRETSSTPFDVSKILQTPPSQYPQLGSQINDLMERDPGFNAYYQQVERDGSLEGLVNLEGVRGIDSGFLETMESYYNVPAHKVAAAMSYYGLNPDTAVNSQNQPQQEPKPSKKPVEYIDDSDGTLEDNIMAFYEVDEATAARMVDLTDDWIMNQPEDVYNHLASIKDKTELFKLAYGRMRHDMKQAEKQTAQRAKQRDKMPRFTEKELSEMSPEAYAKNADAIYKAYQLGLVSK
ncbi:hypothetical protein [Myxosarcina sp. GI1(2024)]